MITAHPHHVSCEDDKKVTMAVKAAKAANLCSQKLSACHLFVISFPGCQASCWALLALACALELSTVF